MSDALELATPEPTQEQRAIIERAEANGHRAVGEPLIYEYRNRRSYCRDLALRESRNTAAGERLRKHMRQMQAVPKREMRSLEGVEFRVNPNLTAGTGGEFAPPLWLNELFAMARRPGEVIQRLAPTFDLPPGVSSVNLPRMTQGTVASQNVAGTPVDDQDVETEAVKSPAATFVGMSDWALQALEQSPAGAHLDWVVFKDLFDSLDAEVEYELIAGSGENERFYGLINVAGNNKITYTSANPTGPGMIPYLGQAAAQVGVKRRLPPEAWLATTSRFFWLAFSEDSANRPLSIEDYPHSNFPNAGLGSVGVYFDDAITTTLGVSKEQDVVIACRPSDFVLLVSEPKPSVKLDVLSGSLSARFELHRYVAAILGRYPSGISVVEGTGMKTQEGFH